MKKILFITHDASRTGAPIILLNFLKWLKNENKFEIFIFLKQGGDMEADFKKVGATYTSLKRNLAQRVFKKVASKTGLVNETRWLSSDLLKQSFDAIYLNTVACLDLAPYLKSVFNCPVICHVHENEFTIKYYYDELVNNNNLCKVDRFIAVSQSTRKNLIEQHNVAPEKVSLVYEFIPIREIKESSQPKEVIKKELGLADEFIVGGSGLTIWRKGIDLFVQLAVLLSESQAGKPVKLIWVGDITHEFKTQFNYEADRLGITAQIIFTGVKSVPQNYFQLFDVFVLTSREDPFPLVALEAAALNKPILCFDNSGGLPEFIENEKNGIIIPYGNVKEMAKKILQLVDDDNKRVKMGEEAGKLIENFDVDIAGRQISQLIEQLIADQ